MHNNNISGNVRNFCCTSMHGVQDVPNYRQAVNMHTMLIQKCSDVRRLAYEKQFSYQLDVTDCKLGHEGGSKIICWLNMTLRPLLMITSLSLLLQ